MLICPTCERRAGGCLDCPNPVTGRAKRCGPCRRRRDLAQERARSKARRQEHPGVEAAYKRRWYATRPPEQRAQEIARRKRWKAENPLKVAAHRRKGRLKGTMGYRTRAGYLTATREYRATHREEIRARDRERYRAKHPPKTPTCATCGSHLEYFGRGRQPKWCDAHRPYPIVKARREGRWQDRRQEEAA